MGVHVWGGDRESLCACKFVSGGFKLSCNLWNVRNGFHMFYSSTVEQLSCSSGNTVEWPMEILLHTRQLIVTSLRSMALFPAALICYARAILVQCSAFFWMCLSTRVSELIWFHLEDWFLFKKQGMAPRLINPGMNSYKIKFITEPDSQPPTDNTNQIDQLERHADISHKSSHLILGMDLNNNNNNT